MDALSMGVCIERATDECLMNISSSFCFIHRYVGRFLSTSQNSRHAISRSKCRKFASTITISV